MKKIFFCLLPFICFAHESFCQHKCDTVFLKRTFIDSLTYNVIFIERNLRSEEYGHILERIAFDKSNYLRALNEQKDSGIVVKHFHLPAELPRDWISIWLYNGTYYAYSASEPWVNERIWITDSAVAVNDFSDGVIPLLLQSAPIKINATTWQFNISHGSKDKIMPILFHWIDRKREIAIVEYPRGPYARYSLLVNSKRIKEFPLIINLCNEQRVLEWKFDEPDYARLLQAKKR